MRSWCIFKSISFLLKERMPLTCINWKIFIECIYFRCSTFLAIMSCLSRGKNWVRRQLTLSVLSCAVRLSVLFCAVLCLLLQVYFSSVSRSTCPHCRLRSWSGLSNTPIIILRSAIRTTRTSNPGKRTFVDALPKFSLEHDISFLQLELWTRTRGGCIFVNAIRDHLWQIFVSCQPQQLSLMLARGLVRVPPLPLSPHMLGIPRIGMDIVGGYPR